MSEPTMLTCSRCGSSEWPQDMTIQDDGCLLCGQCDHDVKVDSYEGAGEW